MAEQPKATGANWPRCPVCNKFAKTGHITCGNPGCDESKLRQERVLEYWRIRKPKGETRIRKPKGEKSHDR